MRFELFQDEKEDWCWQLRDESSQIIAASSVGHPNKKHAYAVIDGILKMEKADIVDVRQ